MSKAVHELQWSDLIDQKDYFDLEKGDIFLSEYCYFRCVKDFYFNGITIKSNEVVKVKMRGQR